MAKKAKRVVEITVKLKEDGQEQVETFVGDGSYVVLLIKNKTEKVGNLIGQTSINRREENGMMIALLDIVKGMVNRKPSLLSVLMAYLDGEVPKEAFMDLSAGDDQSEEPKVETEETDEAEGGDDGEDH